MGCKGCLSRSFNSFSIAVLHTSLKKGICGEAGKVI